MCGIVGYVGPRDATNVILEGLTRLEYRGYDSAGLAVITDNGIAIRRDKGKIINLKNIIAKDPVRGLIGIGHTRWATHGQPSTQNAHPHLGATGKVAVVHNGIIENHLVLRSELEKEGVQFNSETDTEIIVHLVEKYLNQGKNFETSTRLALNLLEGSHAVVLLSTIEPDRIFVSRIGHGGGVVIGLGKGEMFIASDIPAILKHTRKMVFLEPGQLAEVLKDDLIVSELGGKAISYKIKTIDWDAEAAEKGQFEHFMLKEIHEQPQTVVNTIGGRADFANGSIHLSDIHMTSAEAKQINRIVITACGTAAHAGMTGKILIEKLARIPVEVDVASEFRYRDPLVDEHSIVIAISQSGETADTLAAMSEARKKGARLWSIVNVIGSQAMRIADGCVSMQAGPEIGVASTKAYLAPLIDLYMLAIFLGEKRGTITPAEVATYVNDLRNLAPLVAESVKRLQPAKRVAESLVDVSHCLFLGRGVQMPTAFEGALKLKEISYIHAEAYAAGEMKHGPIALIDPEMPVVAIATRDPWHDKMIYQIEQVKARGGRLIAVGTDGDERLAELADDILWVPDTPWMLGPVTTIIPLQLLAYYAAVLRGADVDQPRNLAKSVTVE